jgi:SHS2 domain-containing protein
MMSGAGNLTMASNYWEHFHHIADIGGRDYGVTVENSFEQAALALSSAALPPGELRKKHQVPTRSFHFLKRST